MASRLFHALALVLVIAVLMPYGVPTSAAPLSPTPCAPRPSGLVSWWSGDGDTGHAEDIWGNNDGTEMNGATNVQGKDLQAFSFDGLDDFVEIPNNSAFTPSAFTVEGWFYIDPYASGNVGEQSTFVSKSDYASASGGWVLLFDDRRDVGIVQALDFEVYGGSQIIAKANANNTITAANWYHIAAVFDLAASPQATLYLQGQPVASSTGTIPSVLANTYNVRIGAAYYGASDRLNGLADEVDFYNRALSATDIQSIYNAGSSGKCKPMLVPTNGTIPPNKLSRQYFASTSVPDKFYHTDYYGETDNRVTFTTPIHIGVDIQQTPGSDCTQEQSPVYASAAGTVEIAQWLPGWGYNVVISHGTTLNSNGKYVFSQYAHMGTRDIPGKPPKPGTSCIASGITTGTLVSSGQLLGWQGNSGTVSGTGSQGVHLHWGVYANPNASKWRHVCSTGADPNCLAASPDFYTCIDLTDPSTVTSVTAGEYDCDP